MILTPMSRAFPAFTSLLKALSMRELVEINALTHQQAHLVADVDFPITFIKVSESVMLIRLEGE